MRLRCRLIICKESFAVLKKIFQHNDYDNNIKVLIVSETWRLHVATLLHNTLQTASPLTDVEINEQGDHLSGKPGNVREFDSYQGNVKDFSQNRGNVRKKSWQGKVA